MVGGSQVGWGDVGAWKEAEFGLAVEKPFFLALSPSLHPSQTIATGSAHPLASCSIAYHIPHGCERGA